MAVVCRVYAVDAASGAQRWSYATADTVHGSVAVPPHGLHAYVGSHDGHVYKLGADAGAVVWRCDVGSSVRASPVVGVDVVYAGMLDGSVAAIDASTGVMTWRVRRCS